MTHKLDFKGMPLFDVESETTHSYNGTPIVSRVRSIEYQVEQLQDQRKCQYFTPPPLIIRSRRHTCEPVTDDRADAHQGRRPVAYRGDRMLAAVWGITRTVRGERVAAVAA